MHGSEMQALKSHQAVLSGITWEEDSTNLTMARSKTKTTRYLLIRGYLPQIQIEIHQMLLQHAEIC